MAVGIGAQPHLQMKVRADGNACHAHRAHYISRRDPLADRHGDLAEVAVERVDIQLAVTHGQAPFQTDHNRVTVKVVVGAEQLDIVGPGMDDFPLGASEHGRPHRVGHIDAVVGAIAVAGG